MTDADLSDLPTTTNGPIKLVTATGSLTVNDGDVDSNTLAASITYTPQNDAPVLNTASLSVTEGQTVTLTATNGNGSDTLVRTDYIAVDPDPGPPPVADFVGAPTAGIVPLTVDFTDLSTESPTSWAWDFGDGGSSTAQHPSHTYTHAGDYTVSLTVSGAAGSDVHTEAGYIHVQYGAGSVVPALLQSRGW